MLLTSIAAISIFSVLAGSNAPVWELQNTPFHNLGYLYVLLLLVQMLIASLLGDGISAKTGEIVMIDDNEDDDVMIQSRSSRDIVALTKGEIKTRVGGSTASAGGSAGAGDMCRVPLCMEV